MAWTTPKTWNVGDPATAADLNTYVRDNTNALAQGMGQYLGSQPFVGGSGALTGGVPCIAHADTWVGNFSSGTATLNFPFTFPNGVLAVIGSSQDPTVGLAPAFGNFTASSCTVYLGQGATAQSGLHRVGYVVFGN